MFPDVGGERGGGGSQRVVMYIIGCKECVIGGGRLYHWNTHSPEKELVN